MKCYVQQKMTATPQRLFTNINTHGSENNILNQKWSTIFRRGRIRVTVCNLSCKYEKPATKISPLTNVSSGLIAI